MYLGIDIGTSSVKAVLVDDRGAVRGQAEAPLPIARPRAGWSEQDPDDWWSGTCGAIAALPAPLRAQVRAIGLAGQMHGATLLDAGQRPLRPAILWNDGRAAAECGELERIEPRSRALTGNAAMPGFTAPKLLWLRRHEPRIFAAAAHILLPKDYVRLKLTGEMATDPSDASGTLWLDCARRRWSEPMLAACGLAPAQMPRLVEGDAVAGTLRPTVAAELGLPVVPVAGGGGDNAAGAIGAGVVRPGEAMLSLGTSGVLFVVTDRFRPAPEDGVHAFCHALPGRWHQMGVILSAASCLDWVARLTGHADTASALAAAAEREPFAGPELFLPYLSGERTPHADANARGVLFGLDPDSDGPALVQAVLEGVAFALADAADVVRASGTDLAAASVIGGGARSLRWGRILATALDLPLVYRDDGQCGPAVGAARLARLAAGGEPAASVCTAPPVHAEIAPDERLRPRAIERLARYRALYPALKEQFR